MVIRLGTSKIKFVSYGEFYNENTNMPLIRFEKIVHSLPTGSEIKPNTVYFLREGQGFSTFVSDATGGIIHKLNIPKASQTDENLTPVKTWIEYITEYKFQQGVQLEGGAMQYKNESLEPNTVYRLIKNNVDYILDRPSLEGATIYAKRGL